MDQWPDPRLGFGNHVQVMSKTGDQFRGGWTEHFAKHENFDFVRDVKILRTEFEGMTGPYLDTHVVPQWASEIDHHPHELDRCIGEMLQPSRLQNLTIPITITVSIGQPYLTTTPSNKK